MMLIDPIDLAAIREGRIATIGRIVGELVYEGDCQHPHHVIDATLRRVTCEDCGEILDPIEVILEYAKFWQRQSAALEHLTKLRKAEYERLTWRTYVVGRVELPRMAVFGRAIYKITL
jgi:hypothetical protein